MTKKFKLTPVGNRIIVKVIEEKEQVKGGIIIPDSAKEKPQKAKVIFVGNGKKKEDGSYIPMDFKAGNIIIFAKYGGYDIKIDDEDYLILPEEDVLAIEEEK